MAGDPLGRKRVGVGPDRVRQDARRVPDLPRRSRARRSGREPARHDAGTLRVAAEGAQQRHSQEPRRAVVGYRHAGGRTRPHVAGDTHGRPHRRHAGVRTPADGEASAAHSRHDPGVAVHSADGRSQPPGAARRQDGDRRRDSRDGRRQAGRASGAVAGEARRSRGERLADCAPSGLDCQQR